MEEDPVIAGGFATGELHPVPRLPHARPRLMHRVGTGEAVIID